MVLDSGTMLTGHDEDLVRLAGCSQARTQEESDGIARRALLDETCRRQRAGAAGSDADGLSAASWRDSAWLIASVVTEVAEILELVG